MTEQSVRESIVRAGHSLHGRGLTPGASGNISVRSADATIMTPTGASLGELSVEYLSVLGSDGRHLGGPKPTKEAGLHCRLYAMRPDIRAVVHLHSPHSVALSLLADINHHDAVPALTPYQVMRVGRLPVVPYAKPGSTELEERLAARLGDARCALLANHGTIAGGATLAAAVEAAEEIEQTARIWLLTGNSPIQTLTPDDVAGLIPGEVHQL